jgi:hypothetical protein
MTTALSQFDGRDVVASGIEMPGASGGLNKALRVDNLELHHNDTVHVVIEAQVRKVRFDKIDEDAPVLERVHVLKVQNAAIIGADAVAELLAQQRKRVEEAAGVHHLPFDEAGDVPDEDVPDEGPAPDNVTSLG